MARSISFDLVIRVMSALVLAALGVACSETPPPPMSAADTTLRSTAQGELIGFESAAGAHVWRGIPFAEPPVGDLRWRAPRAPTPWSGRREALEFGSPCAQFAGLGGDSDDELTGSEDCLYLNVFTPPFDSDAVPNGDNRLPVMVWIHGGGNTVGDALIYDASTLAVKQNLVVVTIHYRLGVFGWFHHDALWGEGDDADDRSGNYGTLDAIRALTWVRDHVSAFGGDPDRVTVFGESAGGTDTFAMLVSPRAAGLLHGAITQSGSTQTMSLAEASNAVDDIPAGHPNSSSEQLFGLLIADGKAVDREGARTLAGNMEDDEIAAYLRDKTPAELLARFVGKGFFAGMYNSPGLLRDGHVLPADSMQSAFAAGRYNRVPAIFGTNRDEGKLFMFASSPHVARAGIMPLWFKNERMYDLGAEYGARLWKARGADRPAETISSGGLSKAWVYRFDWDEEGSFLWADLSRLIGASHALELPFVFGTLNLGRARDYVFPEETRATAFALAHDMMDYWGEFARTGDPNGVSDAVPWPSWASEAGRYLVFDTEAGGGIRTSDQTAERSLVIAGVATDARLESDAERCEIYGQMARFGAEISEAEYRSIEGGLCENVPLPQ